MQRETRINLIFLALFIALIAPGAVILVRKKLQPSASRMDMPDPVRRQLPYMAPQATPPEVIRFIPPRTSVWLHEVIRRRTGLGTMLLRERQPVMSSDRRLQLVGVASHQTGTQAHLLVWTPQLLDSRPKVSVDGQPLGSEQVSTAREPIPEEIRREWVSMGFVKPPGEVGWMSVQLTATGSGELRVGWNGGGSSTVNVFTSPYP